MAKDPELRLDLDSGVLNICWSQTQPGNELFRPRPPGAPLALTKGSQPAVPEMSDVSSRGSQSVPPKPAAGEQHLPGIHRDTCKPLTGAGRAALTGSHPPLLFGPETTHKGLLLQVSSLPHTNTACRQIHKRPGNTTFRFPTCLK